MAVNGGRTHDVRALPQRPKTRDRGILHTDGATRGNAGAAIGDSVAVSVCGPAATLRQMRLTGPVGMGAAVLRRVLVGAPLSAGDRFRMPLVKGRKANLHIVSPGARMSIWRRWRGARRTASALISPDFAGQPPWLRWRVTLMAARRGYATPISSWRCANCSKRFRT